MGPAEPPPPAPGRPVRRAARPPGAGAGGPRAGRSRRPGRGPVRGGEASGDRLARQRTYRQLVRTGPPGHLTDDPQCVCGGRRWTEADGRPPGGFALHSPDHRACGVDPQKDRGHADHQPGTGLRRTERPPTGQLDAQLPFQRCCLLGNDGLRTTQLPGRVAEGAVRDDSREGPEQARVHRISITCRGMRSCRLSFRQGRWMIPACPPPSHHAPRPTRTSRAPGPPGSRSSASGRRACPRIPATRRRQRRCGAANGY